MASNKVRAVKGMNDVLPGATESFLDSALWQFIVDSARDVLESYGYHHVLLPVVEETALFMRGIGSTTDIVAKEMYSFEDRGGRQLTLRPEGTASAVRAYVEHNFAGRNPLQRWWYAGPMYRAERPQKGRYRQFYQIGAELFGSAEPWADAELIASLWQLCQRLGLADITIRLNSLGDDESRQAFRTALGGYLQQHREALCESCRERVATNPLRSLDCKRDGCKAIVADSPSIEHSRSAASSEHFDAVRQALDHLAIPYFYDQKLVRGLDYYTGTLFEFVTSALGAQDAILGGGRYDNLVQELGGAPTPAIGFAAGVERLALLLAEQPRFANKAAGPDLYIVPMAGSETTALEFAAALRQTARCRVEVDVAGGKLKQQMKRADRAAARFAMVLGEHEVSTRTVKLKEMTTADEIEITLDVDLIAAALGAQLPPQQASTQR